MIVMKIRILQANYLHAILQLYSDTYLRGLATLIVFFFLFFTNTVAITIQTIITMIISATTTPTIIGIGVELDDDEPPIESASSLISANIITYH